MKERDLIEAIKKFVGGTEYNGLVKEEQELLGLEGWQIGTRYAQGKLQEEMKKQGWVAAIGANPQTKRATIFFNKEALEDENIDKRAVIDHELAHLIINPYE